MIAQTSLARLYNSCLPAVLVGRVQNQNWELACLAHGDASDGYRLWTISWQQAVGKGRCVIKFVYAKHKAMRLDCYYLSYRPLWDLNLHLWLIPAGTQVYSTWSAQ